MHNTLWIHYPIPDTNTALSARAEVTLTSDGILICNQRKVHIVGKYMAFTTESKVQRVAAFYSAKQGQMDPEGASTV